MTFWFSSVLRSFYSPVTSPSNFFFFWKLLKFQILQTLSAGRAGITTIGVDLRQWLKKKMCFFHEGNVLIIMENILKVMFTKHYLVV